ncbi:hypothetical protein LINPERHAP1_LOCUS10560 [Linum perenne]
MMGSGFFFTILNHR